MRAIIACNYKMFVTLRDFKGGDTRTPNRNPSLCEGPQNNGKLFEGFQDYSAATVIA
jgi:hypothetical protein